MVMAKKVKARSIEPMLLLRTDALPNERERSRASDFMSIVMWG
jgi:hypothetical protein